MNIAQAKKKLLKNVFLFIDDVLIVQLKVRLSLPIDSNK